MTYELAKQLKDARFPQGNFKGYRNYYSKPYKEHVYDIFDTVQSYSCHSETDSPPVFAPTLSELIESFQSRYKYIDGLINDAQVVLRKTLGSGGNCYIAYLDGDWESHDKEQKYVFIDKDANVALSNLWLALNKK